MITDMIRQHIEQLMSQGDMAAIQCLIDDQLELNMETASILISQALRYSRFDILCTIIKQPEIQVLLGEENKILVKLLKLAAAEEHWTLCEILMGIKPLKNIMTTYQKMTEVLAGKHEYLEAVLSQAAALQAKSIWQVTPDEIEMIILARLKSFKYFPCYKSITTLMSVCHVGVRHKLLILGFSAKHGNWSLAEQIIKDPVFNRAMSAKVCHFLLPSAKAANCEPVMRLLTERLQATEGYSAT